MENRKPIIQDIYYSKPLARPAPRISYTPDPPLVPLQVKSHSEPVRSKRTKSKSKLIFGVFSLLAITVGGGILLKASLMPSDNRGVDVPKVQAASVQTAPVEEKLKPIDFVGIETQIKAIIERYPSLQISVAYTDIKTTTTVKAGVDEVYNAASTAKLLTAVLFLQETQSGKYSLETPVGGIAAKEQLRKMIELSDNASWLAFNSLLTSAALNEFAKDSGLLNYNSRTNTSTPADIALLLEKLYKNQLLSQENTQLLLSYMQHASEQQYIPAALPAGTKVYHKAGYLNDRAHDAAIIDNGKRPFVLVIFTKSSGNYDFELGRKVMHEITGAIWPAYTD